MTQSKDLPKIEVAKFFVYIRFKSGPAEILTVTDATEAKARAAFAAWIKTPSNTTRLLEIDSAINGQNFDGRMLKHVFDLQDISELRSQPDA